ncbi:MAG TPA: RNA polymerase sigma-70 factor [Mucilaginibacter sp.]|jgi:RNA polymerase sigma-70 factor (family 1)|nr:RNA polymerase sigma-70 factor [Mucilaginibacter sp.]
MTEYKALIDSELAVLFQQQDRKAFEEIYRRYWHPLFLHAYHILDDEDEAQDIIQDIFISFWNKPPTDQIHTSLKSYLYVMVRNKVLNHIRKNKISANFIQLLSTKLTEKDFNTIQDIELKELAELIDKEIDLLPPRMKQVFEMSRKEFLTHKEIAERLGTSEETVKKQITNSLKLLRVKFNQHLFVAVLLAEAIRHGRH